MEVSETLKKAWTAVEDAGLPEKIHEAAFREAVRLLVPVPVVITPAAVGQAGKPSRTDGSGAAGGRSNGDGGITVSEDDIYDRVVAQTGVDREKLEQVVHLDDGTLRVSVPGIKLGKNNAERARAVAQILTITRSFGIEEHETSLDVIRAECDRLRVYDQANFSSHMKALTGYVITGSGGNRRVRAKGPGIAAFPALVDKLLGAES
jgi:hypothetical protein